MRRIQPGREITAFAARHFDRVHLALAETAVPVGEWLARKSTEKGRP